MMNDLRAKRTQEGSEEERTGATRRRRTKRAWDWREMEERTRRMET
jgi:hypothetical protein